MSHSHNHVDHAGEGSKKRLRAAFFLNAFFTVIELIGGLLTNSVAILSDALHDAGDTVSLGLAWYLQGYSQKEGDQNYTYGYRRFGLLSAFINGLILVSGSVIILFEAVPRLFAVEIPDYRGMIIISIVGLLFNGIAAWRLRGNHSLNEKMVFWHLMEDVGGWTLVLASSIVMLQFQLPILDPIVSIAFTLFILYNVVRNLIQVSRIFLQKSPREVDASKIQKEVEGLAGIASTHDVHIWSMDGEEHVLTMHAVLSETVDQNEIPEIKNRIREVTSRHGINHPTIEIELPDEDCVMADCT